MAQCLVKHGANFMLLLV